MEAAGFRAMSPAGSRILPRGPEAEINARVYALTVKNWLPDCRGCLGGARGCETCRGEPRSLLQIDAGRGVSLTPLSLCPSLQQVGRGHPPPHHVGRTGCCSQAIDSSVHPGTPSPSPSAYCPSVWGPVVQLSSSVKSTTSLCGGGPISVRDRAWASCPARFPTPGAGQHHPDHWLLPAERQALTLWSYRPWQPASSRPHSQFPGHLLLLVTCPRNLLPRSPS